MDKESDRREQQSKRILDNFLKSNLDMFKDNDSRGIPDIKDILGVIERPRLIEVQSFDVPNEQSIAGELDPKKAASFPNY